MFNPFELELIGRIEEAKRYVIGELELDHFDGGWYAMDYREEFGQAFDIKRYGDHFITDEEIVKKQIDIEKCCNWCAAYYVG